MMKFDNRKELLRARMSKNLVFDSRPKIKNLTIAQQIAAIMAGRVGVWYDASDLSTMYQDAAGTTPVTGVGQPVGLWLDKSQGDWLSTPVPTYSADFTSSVDAWLGYRVTPALDNGWLKATGTTVGSTGNLYKNIPTQVTSNGLYKFSVKVKVDPATITYMRLFAQTVQAPYTDMTPTSSLVPFTDSSEKILTCYMYVFDYTKGTQIKVLANTVVAGQLPVFFIDDVVVEKVHPSANHAFQNASTKRPVLRQYAGGKYYLEADGVDDGMITVGIPWSGTNAIISCAYIVNGSTDCCLIETSPASNANAGAILMLDSSLGLGCRIGSTVFSQPTNTTARVSDQKRVASTYSDGSVLTLRLATNNNNSTTTNVGTLQPYSASIMFRLGNGTPNSFLSGAMYGLIVLNKTYSDADRVLIEQYLAQQIGVTLP